MAKKRGKNRKSEVSTTLANLRKRLERAKRLNKSENYIKDLEKSIERTGR